jgi:hypothetical protein
MRDPARIPELLRLVRCYWDQYPDLRLGQLIANLSDYYTEDDVLKDRIRAQLDSKAEETDKP